MRQSARWDESQSCGEEGYQGNVKRRPESQAEGPKEGTEGKQD